VRRNVELRLRRVAGLSKCVGVTSLVQRQRSSISVDLMTPPRLSSRLLHFVILMVASSVVYAAPAAAHEDSLEIGLRRGPVGSALVTPTRVDRNSEPTERFISVADRCVEGMTFMTLPTPFTPDSQRLWISSAGATEASDESCSGEGPTALATVNLDDAGGERVVHPGTFYQPPSIGDLHRGPLQQALLTDSLGRPIALAETTPSGDLVNIRTLDFEAGTKLLSLRWVQFDSGSCCHQWAVPGLVLQLDGPNGISTARIEAATGRLKTREASEINHPVWPLDTREQRVVHREGDSRRIVMQSTSTTDHEVLALWPNPIRGVSSTEGRHAMFSDDGLMVINVAHLSQRATPGDYTKDVLTRDVVTDAAWTPAADALVWTGPDGTWIATDNRTHTQLSTTGATAVDVSPDGTMIVAVEPDGYRVFTWLPQTDPEEPDTISAFTPLTANGLGPLRLGGSLDALPEKLATSLSLELREQNTECVHFQLIDRHGQPIATGFAEVTPDGPLIRSIIVSRNPNEWAVAYGASHASVIEQFGDELTVIGQKFSYDIRLIIELPERAAEVLFLSDQQTIHEARLGTPGWVTFDNCVGP